MSKEGSEHLPAGQEEPIRPEAGTGGRAKLTAAHAKGRMANKYIFKCSTSPLVREMQLKQEELTLQHPRVEQNL